MNTGESIKAIVALIVDGRVLVRTKEETIGTCSICFFVPRSETRKIPCPTSVERRLEISEGTCFNGPSILTWTCEIVKRGRWERARKRSDKRRRMVTP
jgi:hypothetical protein